MSAPLLRYVAHIVLMMWVVVGAARTAKAETTLVVLASAPAGRASDAEVVNRVRGELLADGFTVQSVAATPDEDRAAILARAGRAAGVAVAAGLWIVEEARAVELVLVDELTGRTLTRRLDADPSVSGQAPEVIARRSVDFLRAGLLDFLVESLRSAVSEVHAPQRPVPKVEDDTERSRWAIEAGVGLLGSFEGAGPAAMPLGRVRFAVTPAWQLRVTTAWLGTQPIVETSAGAASVAQGIALLECTAHVWRRRPLHPFVSLGAGTYYVGVTGSGVPPDQGERSTAFSFAFAGGVGVAALIGTHFEVLLEAQGVFADPAIAIRLLGVDSARIGRPSVLGALTIAGWI